MTTFASPTHAWRVAFSLIGIDLKQGLRKHLAGASARGWLLKFGGLLFGLGFFAMLPRRARGNSSPWRCAAPPRGRPR